MKRAIPFRLPSGEEPFQTWVDGLPELLAARVAGLIELVCMGGGKKNVRALGDGVFEIKLHTGAGYRIYFGQDGGNIILLLCGGDKSTQDRDISRAKKYWRHYRESP